MAFYVWKYRRVPEMQPKPFERKEDALKEMERLQQQKIEAKEDWIFMVVERKNGGR